MRNLIFLLFCVYLISCSPSSNAILHESVAIPETGWAIDNPVRFAVEITDTNRLYDIYITVRHNTDYEWMNLFLFMKTYYPDLEFSRDTLECFLADETGRWFGRGSSSVRDHVMLLQRNVRFPQKGRYQFEFVHGMRAENLRNIMDLGMKIVPSR
ncbi:MAG: gliding motility lipoprotein GldH [Bacteroidales bacterium]|nr:gliding motility lipoprotein GldH [Bacteroidales bacterium]